MLLHGNAFNLVQMMLWEKYEMESQQDLWIHLFQGWLTLSARVILEAKKCFDWTVEGAGGSVGEHNKMKVSEKSESEVSAGRVCYKMEIYLEENEEKDIIFKSI